MVEESNELCEIDGTFGAETGNKKDIEDGIFLFAEEGINRMTNKRLSW